MVGEHAGAATRAQGSLPRIPQGIRKAVRRESREANHEACLYVAAMIDHPVPATKSPADDALRQANVAFAAAHPGDPAARQPVHTVIVGAHNFDSGLIARMGAEALAAMDRDAPDAATFADVLRLPDVSAHTLRDRVAARLAAEPVEDLRIDFEDGYGHRGDAAEDAEVARVTRCLVDGMSRGTLPAFVGVRVKALNEELRARSVRTTELLVGGLMEQGGALPANFVITIPKVTVIEQIDATVALLQGLEARYGMAPETLRFEIMVETPQLVMDASGTSLLARVPAAAQGRLRGAHFGTYDYTAGLGITAAQQRMRHPACEFAKAVMGTALAATGVWLADGSTSLLPVGDRAAVHRGWRLHFDDVQHSLAGGFYQGYDLHATQLVTRYAALYAFFQEGLEAAGARLRRFMEGATQATGSGAIFDEPATGQGLLSFFLRAVNCGAIDAPEACRLSGLTPEELRGQSFVRVLAARSS